MKHADIFIRLGALIESGNTMEDAFLLLSKTKSRGVREGFLKAARLLKRGGDLKDALTMTGLFELFEIKMLAFGEHVGHFPESCRRLAKQSERRRTQTQNLIMQLAYPLFLIHVMILIPSLIVLFRSGMGAYLKTIGPALGFFYLSVIILFVLVKLVRFSPFFSASIDKFLLSTPLVGGGILRYQLSQTLTMLQGLYSSGMPIIDGMDQVMETIRNHGVRSMMQGVHEQLKKGDSLTQAFVSASKMPAYVHDLIAVGEQSGKLDETLLKACARLDEEAATRTTVLLKIITTIFFLAIAGFLAKQVIDFYVGYFNQMNSMIE